MENFSSDIRLGQKVKLISTKKKVELKNKPKKTDEEISNLKVQIVTKDQFLLVAKDRVQTEALNEVLQEVIVHKFVKNCKRCSFLALKMKVVGLHIENDHQYILFFKYFFLPIVYQYQ